MDGGEPVVENHTRVPAKRRFRAGLHHFHEALRSGPGPPAPSLDDALGAAALDPPDRGRLRGRSPRDEARAGLRAAAGAGRSARLPRRDAHSAAAAPGVAVATPRVVDERPAGGGDQRPREGSFTIRLLHDRAPRHVRRFAKTTRAPAASTATTFPPHPCRAQDHPGRRPALKGPGQEGASAAPGLGRRSRRDSRRGPRPRASVAAVSQPQPRPEQRRRPVASAVLSDQATSLTGLSSPSSARK